MLPHPLLLLCVYIFIYIIYDFYPRHFSGAPITLSLEMSIEDIFTVVMSRFDGLESVKPAVSKDNAPLAKIHLEIALEEGLVREQNLCYLLSLSITHTHTPSLSPHVCCHQQSKYKKMSYFLFTVFDILCFCCVVVAVLAGSGFIPEL